MSQKRCSVFEIEFLPVERSFLRGAEGESKPTSFSLSPRLVIYILLFGLGVHVIIYSFERRKIIYIFIHIYILGAPFSLSVSRVFALRACFLCAEGGSGWGWGWLFI